MPYLHFNADSGRETQTRLQQTEQTITTELDTLTSAVTALVGNGWQAGGAAQFEQAIVQWRGSMQAAQQSLNALTSRLGVEIAQWEETAAAFGDGGIVGGGESQQISDSVNVDLGIGDSTVQDGFSFIPSWSQIVSTIDNVVRDFLENTLPEDLKGQSEFITFKGEGGVIIPLAELDLPFSGYLDGSKGITIKRDDGDGTYRVIIGQSAAGGADFSQDKILEGQVGLRGEGETEFVFNPEAEGDITKMTFLLTSLAGSSIASSVLGFTPFDSTLQTMSKVLLKDNVLSTKSGIGPEGKISSTVGDLDVKGTSIIGIEKRRDSLNDESWETVISRKISGEVNGKLPIDAFIPNSGNLTGEIIVNDIIDSNGAIKATEVVLEIESSPGESISSKDVAELLPVGAEIEHDVTGKMKLVYRLNEPTENIIRSLKEGDFSPIKENSSVEITTSTGNKTTISGDIKKSLAPGQTFGGKMQGEFSSGYEISGSI